MPLSCQFQANSVYDVSAPVVLLPTNNTLQPQRTGIWPDRLWIIPLAFYRHCCMHLKDVWIHSALHLMFRCSAVLILYRFVYFSREGCLSCLTGRLLTSTGMSLQGAGVEPRCRCIGTESRRIGKLISRVELFSPSSHCKDTEIMWVTCASPYMTPAVCCFTVNSSWPILDVGFIRSFCLAISVESGHEISVSRGNDFFTSLIYPDSATLKDSGKEICLDPNAPWVKKVIVNILSR